MNPIIALITEIIVSGLHSSYVPFELLWIRFIFPCGSLTERILVTLFLLHSFFDSIKPNTTPDLKHNLSRYIFEAYLS